MIVILFVGVLCVLITYISEKLQLKWGLEISFVLIALLSSIRYEYGNDYTSYQDIFDYYSNMTFSEVLLYTDKEYGWSILCWLFGFFSFQTLVAFLSIIESYIFYSLLKNNVEEGKRWLALFLYVFTPILFLVQLSMMRQTLAIAIILLSVPLIAKKKVILASVLVFFATIFHTTSIIFFPFVFLCYLNQSKFNIFWIVVVGLSLVVFLNRDLMAVVFNLVFSSNVRIESYDVYTIDNGSEAAKLGVGSLVNTFYIFLSLLVISKQEYKIALMTLLLSISLLTLPFVELGVNIRRIGYYFDIFMIVVFPMMFDKIPNGLVSKILIIVLIIMTLYQFSGFFYNEIWIDSYLNFKSIISK